MRQHRLHASLAHAIDTVEIDIDGRIPERVVHIGDGGGGGLARDTGIVDEACQGAKFSFRAFHRFGHLLVARNIEVDGNRPAAHRPDLLGD